MTKNRILMMAMALCVAVAMSAQSAATQSPQDGEQVYEMVDEQPQFPGGEEGLMKWLRGNLRYPPKAKKQGKAVRVRFTLPITFKLP